MPIRSRARRRARALVGAVVGGLLLLALSAPAALAKEGVEVTLAAPLPADAEPGDTVTAVFVLTSISDSGDRPLRGAPVFIRLYGPTGAMTQASGVEERIPGTYRARIAIPAGGAARAEFGIRGSATDASGASRASDLVWPYDGVLVAAGVPPGVDPDTFRLPGSGPAVDPAAGAAPAPATDAAGSGATVSGPAADGLPWIAAVLPAIAGMVLLVAFGRRRMERSAA